MRVLVACEESQEVCKAFRALDREAVYKLQIAVLNRAVLDWMQPDVLYRREELTAFFNNPVCEFLYNPFPGITLPEMLEVLKNGRYKLDS